MIAVHSGARAPTLLQNRNNSSKLSHQGLQLTVRSPLAASQCNNFVKALPVIKMSDRKRARVDACPTGEYPSEGEVSPSFKVPGLVIRDIKFQVPLDWSGKVPGQIDLFVREVSTPTQVTKKGIPYLLYLQGGPGFESPRPTDSNGWLRTATQHFKVILMDQRGTGHSSGITTTNLKKRGDAKQQAQYLSFFRADSIVQDAEYIRQQMVPSDNLNGTWSILGQSFGGFCAFTYMSQACRGLTEVMITGGIPPGIGMACSADTVYRALYARVMTLNERYYRRFPGDKDVMKKIVQYIKSQPNGYIELPNGSHLTVRMLQTLGLSGLGSGGGLDRLHYLINSFFDSEGEVTPSFIKSYESWGAWDTNPLYILLHESIYCQGAASNWAAHRVREADPVIRAAFDADLAIQEDRPVYFTGEMVYPWMMDDVVCLRQYKEAADIIARKADWPALYNPQALQEVNVPVATATYVEDMYVDFNLAQDSAKYVPTIRQWITNEYKHSGIRDDGVRILDKLLNMVRDAILIE